MLSKIAVISGHLQIAFSYVSDAWFPVHPELLQVIRMKLTSGELSTPSELITELKKDFSLYTHCLGKISRYLKEKGAPSEGSDPLAFLESPLGPTALNELLSSAATPPSRHSILQTNAHQARQMQRAITAASVAESLAESSEVSPNLTYTCSLLRHLGLVLVMWNYPHVYSRSTETLGKGQSFDDTLTKKLGFSPTMLGIVIARQWGLSPEARLAIGDKNVRGLEGAPLERAQATADTIRKLCEIGELFADLSGTNDQLKAAADIEQLRADLQQRLGDEGMQLLARTIDERCELYVRALPQLFRPPTPIIKARSDSRLATRHLHNRYVAQCPPAFREQINRVYNLLDDKTARRQAVDELVHAITPSAGFTRGCVYLVEPESMTLRPRLAIGNSSLDAFEPTPIRGPARGAAQTAFHALVPILGIIKAVSEGQRTCYIAASLGTHQRMGVLYLEHPEPAGSVAGRTLPLTYFKAIRQAFTDCLNIF